MVGGRGRVPAGGGRGAPCRGASGRAGGPVRGDQVLARRHTQSVAVGPGHTERGGAHHRTAALGCPAHSTASVTRKPPSIRPPPPLPPPPPSVTLLLLAGCAPCVSSARRGSTLEGPGPRPTARSRSPGRCSRASPTAAARCTHRPCPPRRCPPRPCPALDGLVSLSLALACSCSFSLALALSLCRSVALSLSLSLVSLVSLPLSLSLALSLSLSRLSSLSLSSLCCSGSLCCAQRALAHSSSEVRGGSVTAAAAPRGRWRRGWRPRARSW